MDYQVFLLSRIRERYDQTHDTAAAITFGVASTARIITGAALIIVAVFAGFAQGDLIMFQQMGFGIGAARSAALAWPRQRSSSASSTSCACSAIRSSSVAARRSCRRSPKTFG
jgi:uncharacterized membrane protein YdfJ with MMPL/SSD domain